MENQELSINEALNLAVKKHNEGKLHEAEIIYRKILEVDKHDADALHLLGLIAHQVGKNLDALELIKKAIKIKQNSAIYYGNLGMVYDSLGNDEESANCFKKALELNPNYEKAYLAYYNLGIHYMEEGKAEEALGYYEQAIKLKNDFYDVHWNRGLVLLLTRRFKEGWKEYEYRFKKDNPSDSRVFNKPRWDGSFLDGKRILVLGEQGFGDDIQFIRYLPLIKERGGHIIFECKKELRKLFEGFNGIDEFIEKGNKIELEYDYYIHLMSLPAIFETELDSIPNEIPYLKAKESHKFEHFFENDKFKIGITWAGNPAQENDRNRSMSFENFKALKDIPGISLFSLQKGEASSQLSNLDIINLADEINDFADIAFIIENLDLVISVDTSVAHLAGAMGKKVWTLLTFTPDWRWLIDRNDSPWYPSMKLFRQSSKGDWDSVMNNLVKELRKDL